LVKDLLFAQTYKHAKSQIIWNAKITVVLIKQHVYNPGEFSHLTDLMVLKHQKFNHTFSLVPRVCMSPMIVYDTNHTM